MIFSDAIDYFRALSCDITLSFVLNGVGVNRFQVSVFFFLKVNVVEF